MARLFLMTILRADKIGIEPFNLLELWMIRIGMGKWFLYSV